MVCEYRPRSEASRSLPVDRIVVTTGFRPDFLVPAEMRVAVDPAVEAPPALTPLIDPNFHSCGTVPPHGIAELSTRTGFLRSSARNFYGRAPTFLMATGYEQVRSVVASLAGDHNAAHEVARAAGDGGVQRRSHHRAGRRGRQGRLLRRTRASRNRCLLRGRCNGEGRG